MGFFDKKSKPPRGRTFSRFDDVSPSSLKETMKALGVEPAESARELFGWTEDDDRDGKKELIERKEHRLKERVVNGCSLREEMELEIEIDRERARNMGVSVQEIARTLQLSYSGQRFAYFIRGGKQYQVIGEMQLQDRNEPVNLRMLYVRGDNGELIQLDNLVRVVEKSTPPQLYRFNRFVSATVSANLANGVTIGAGLDEMDKIAAEVLDDSYATDVSGPSKEFRESSNSLMFAFIFALVLIYLVLSAQFESFADPLTIMFTVPLAIFGALATLWVFDFTLNIFSQIGIIMLIGLVTKNGILIVEFANQRKEEGMDVEEAIFGAAVSRLRPILMTSMSTILGILPIALALGAGAESRVPMGAAVIGGLAFSTVLTLFVIPGVYTYLTSKKGVLAKTV